MSEEQPTAPEVRAPRFAVEEPKRRWPLPQFYLPPHWGPTALIFIIGAAPLLLGGVHPATAMGLGMAATLLGLVSLFSDAAARLRLGPACYALILLVGLSVLQLIPLPYSLVAFIAPENARHYLDAYHLIGEEPSWVPLSLAPNDGALALWVTTGVFGIYVSARIFFTEHKLEWFIARLLVVGGIFLFVGIIQSAIFETSVLGIYTPDNALPYAVFRSTLISPSHSATLLGMLSLLALGYGLHATEAPQKNGALLLYLGLAAALVFTLNGQALVTWLASHLLVALVALRWRVQHRWLLAFFILVTLVGLVIGLEFATRAFNVSPLTMVGQDLPKNQEELVLDAESAELLDREPGAPIPGEQALSASDLPAEAEIGRLAIHYLPFGVGRGTFGEVFASQSAQHQEHYTAHANDEYLEIALEFGPIFGLFILLGLGLAFVRVLWKQEESNASLIAGVAAALAFTALQGSHDFSLRIPGVAFLFFGLLGAATAQVQRPAGHSRNRWVLGTILSAVLITALSHIPMALRAEAQRNFSPLRQLIEEKNEDPQQHAERISAQAAQLILEHPLNGYLRILTAIGLLRNGELEAAERWLLDAQSLSPKDYRSSLILGRLYAQRGEKYKAALAFKRAAALQTGPSVEVLNSIINTRGDGDFLRAALPQEEIDRVLLGAMLINSNHFAEALDYSEWLQQQYPEAPHGLELQVRVQLALGFPEAALSPSRELVDRFPDFPVVFVRRAQVFFATGDTQRGIRVLELGLEEHPQSLLLHFRWLRTMVFIDPGLRKKQWQEQIEEELEQLRPYALAHPQSRYLFFFLIGHFQLETHRPRRAVSHFQSALKQGRDPEALRGLLQAYIELANIEGARLILQELAPHLNATEHSQWLMQLQRRREALERSGLIPVEKVLPEPQIE